MAETCLGKLSVAMDYPARPAARPARLQRRALGDPLSRDTLPLQGVVPRKRSGRKAAQTTLHDNRMDPDPRLTASQKK